MALDNTRNDIIVRALKLIGALAADESPQASDIREGEIALNHMVKAWQSSGIHLWNRDEATLTVTPGKNTYRLGEGFDAVAVGPDGVQIPKPLKIPDARRRTRGQDIELTRLGRRDYLNLPNKATRGIPVQFYYDPKIDHGLLYLWPTPDSSTTEILFSYAAPLDVFAAAGSEPDFPDEWVEALTYNLAVRLSPLFGGGQLNIEVAQLATQGKKDLMDWDQESADVTFRFGMR